MAALRAAFGLSVDEAWASYRLLKTALDRAVALVDLTRHPRIVGREVRAARLTLVGQEARELRREVAAPPEKVRREREYDELIEEEYVEFEFSADTAGET